MKNIKTYFTDDQIQSLLQAHVDGVLRTGSTGRRCCVLDYLFKDASTRVNLARLQASMKKHNPSFDGDINGYDQTWSLFDNKYSPDMSPEEFLAIWDEA